MPGSWGWCCGANITLEPWTHQSVQLRAQLKVRHLVYCERLFVLENPGGNAVYILGHRTLHVRTLRHGSDAPDVT